MKGGENTGSQPITGRTWVCMCVRACTQVLLSILILMYACIQITYLEFDCSQTESTLGHCEDVVAFSCMGLRPQIDSVVFVRSLVVDVC